jgi:thermitase
MMRLPLTVSQIRWIGPCLSLLLAATVLVACAAVQAELSPPTALPAECVPDELLVKFRPGADPATVAARHGATIKEELPGIAVFVLTIPAGTVAEKVAVFSADPQVEYAEPNGIMRVPEEPPDGSSPCN